MKQELRNKDTGNFIERYIKSFWHAVQGICYACVYEHNMYIILLAICVVTCGGFYFKISMIEWMICILSFGIVCATELLNSAIEALCDLVTIQTHPLIKIAKDTASGATLIASIATGIVGVMIFLPKIVSLF